jgi:hypothetical protein
MNFTILSFLSLASVITKFENRITEVKYEDGSGINFLVTYLPHNSHKEQKYFVRVKPNLSIETKVIN